VVVAETENAALADLSLDELEDEIAMLASHIYAGTCRWLELVAEVDRRGGFAARSTAEWLAWRCALRRERHASTCASRAAWTSCR
jgi:hypothetical protein